jgi:hypothetical protein
MLDAVEDAFGAVPMPAGVGVAVQLMQVPVVDVKVRASSIGLRHPARQFYNQSHHHYSPAKDFPFPNFLALRFLIRLYTHQGLEQYQRRESCSIPYWILVLKLAISDSFVDIQIQIHLLSMF